MVCVISIPGIKSKRLTVYLVSTFLYINNITVFAGGNLGIPALDLVAHTNDESYSVIELSSFQLEDCRFSPNIAIVLPVFLDHLDYHSGEKEYVRSKSSITKYMDDEGLLVVADQKNAREIAETGKAPKIYFSKNKKIEGCYLNENDILCQQSQRQSKFSNAQQMSQKYKIPIVNLLAASAFAFGCNLKFDPVADLSGFKKLPFRIEEVGKKGEITFYNDSASTNPVSTLAAISTMTEPYALILGGSSKNLRFDNLAAALKSDSNLKMIYLNGETAAEIAAALKKAGYDKDLIKKNNLQEIFTDLRTYLGKIKAVLFSPACASFDQFANYKERGDYFNRLVKEF